MIIYKKQEKLPYPQKNYWMNFSPVNCCIPGQPCVFYVYNNFFGLHNLDCTVAAILSSCSYQDGICINFYLYNHDKYRWNCISMDASWLFKKPCGFFKGCFYINTINSSGYSYIYFIDKNNNKSAWLAPDGGYSLYIGGDFIYCYNSNTKCFFICGSSTGGHPAFVNCNFDFTNFDIDSMRIKFYTYQCKNTICISIYSGYYSNPKFEKLKIDFCKFF